MAKTLKLTGLKTYTNMVMGGVGLKKGESGTFDDHIADKMLEMHRPNAGEGENVMYFEETNDAATYDFQVTDTPTDEAQAKVDATVHAASQRAPVRRAVATK